ncbi:MAG: GNAT family N-acetyltransferase [Cyanobacteria bacterium HKST-UBA04]|nr:GNAT family N-acetyltransferase [Cyanobacteria bacterium HKST-UBA04]MCA9841060.1 GNAT family N-acetyltransferase [Cyanobacteria bacterium HKST-UBA03]
MHEPVTQPAAQNIEVNIRPYRSEDWDSVKLVILSVLQEWGFLPTKKDHEELSALKDNASFFDGFFVAEDPQVFGVIGCAGVLHRDADQCELRKIYLLSKFRGQKIGKTLLNEVLNFARQHAYKRMRFEVHPEMVKHSQAFYERHGFVLSQEAPTYHHENVVYYAQL